MRFVSYLSFLTALLSVSCRNASPALIPAENFTGTVDGKEVVLHTIRGGDITLQATNFGARVVSVFAPDRNGVLEDVVVGRDNIDSYLNPPKERFLGACVGPVANRIGKASFRVGEEVYSLPANDNGVNTLHGGFNGLDMVMWDVVAVTDSTIELHYMHADGQEGFPGNLDINMKYALTSDNSFVITYSAVTDKPAPVNITNHPFFNLRGEGRGSVEDYYMTIKAGRYIPIDSLSIPTGEIASVEGTPFDFRTERRIGENIGEDDIQLKYARGYDHNWCIDKETEGVESVCTVTDRQTGRRLEVLSDQAGLQFYSGNFFAGEETGKYGRPLGFRSSLALETQAYPDAPNHGNFPSILLLPGQTYTHTCIYRFSTVE